MCESETSSVPSSRAHPPAQASRGQGHSEREDCSVWVQSDTWPHAGAHHHLAERRRRAARRRQVGVGCFPALGWLCCSDGAANFIGDVFVSFRFVLGSDSLTISEVTESDEGMYTCIVNTTLDHVSASAALTVVGRFRHFTPTLSQSVELLLTATDLLLSSCRLWFSRGIEICLQRLIFNDVPSSAINHHDALCSNAVCLDL